MLVPTRYEVTRAVCLPMRTLVLLSEEATSVQQVDGAAAQRFLGSTARPWPASWLPGDFTRVLPDLPDLPADLTVIAAPAQAESAFESIAGLVKAG